MKKIHKLIIFKIFLTAWTVIDPPHVHPIKVNNHSLEYQCDSNHSTFWIIFLAVKVLLTKRKKEEE
jgi:hypothetical protein